MKKSILCAAAIAVLILTIKTTSAPANEPVSAPHAEYITIRWSGRENMHLIRPGGDVEFIWPKMKIIKRPDRVDERAFYMNIAMNALAKDGYEFAGLFNDDLVMKRVH